jgi:hypothetical protein
MYLTSSDADISHLPPPPLSSSAWSSSAPHTKWLLRSSEWQLLDWEAELVEPSVLPVSLRSFQSGCGEDIWARCSSSSSPWARPLHMVCPFLCIQILINSSNVLGHSDMAVQRMDPTYPFRGCLGIDVRPIPPSPSSRHPRIREQPTCDTYRLSRWIIVSCRDCTFHHRTHSGWFHFVHLHAPHLLTKQWLGYASGHRPDSRRWCALDPLWYLATIYIHPHASRISLFPKGNNLIEHLF